MVRVVSQSFRAFTVMLWTFQLNYWTLSSLDVESSLGIPAAGPWFIVVLLGIGTAQLALLSPTAPAAAVLAGAVIAGWALFRFPPPLHVRNGLIMLGLPVVFFALIFVGGATDQMVLPYAWGYGVLAGILIGGRNWAGPRLGEPRPPFNSPNRRRRRKRRPRSKQKQTTGLEKPTVGAAHEQ